MRERPAAMSIRPEVGRALRSVLTACPRVPTLGDTMVDVLSDVLRAVRLTGVVFFDFALQAPWVAQAPPAHEIAGRVLPGSQRVLEYHFLMEGHAWAQMAGGEPLYLRAGDLLIFPQGDAHILSSAPGMRAAPDLGMFARTSTPLPLVYDLVPADGKVSTRLICGFFGCDERPFNPLLAALPPVIYLPAAGSDATSRPLGAMLELAIREERRGQPGTENVLSRLSELMLVEALRRYLSGLPADQRSWLAGLRDPVVGRALEAVHTAPAHPWTIESLGRAVGVSRTVLAARFTEMVGYPPMHYLTRWRMQLAARLLHDGEGVIGAAAAVGYESEAAFSRAFKKLMGTPPSRWRQRGREAAR
jgi:AraC-like DNA-binding protein